ncbi:uncharacterized protein BDV17DRAFT_290817 [Aspergillus undulatus]|uniref:uncharacterized protein n=1 Tax=Aspergillus undulatus TaxID=1810928 RepID=UPI003CCDEA4E
MIYTDSQIKDEMSQAAVASYSASIPTNIDDKDPQNYQLQYIAKSSGQALDKPYVSTFPGMDNLWGPAQGVLSEYSLDKQAPADSLWKLEGPCDSVVDYDPAYSSVRPSIHHHNTFQHLVMQQQSLPNFMDDGIPFSLQTSNLTSNLQTPCLQLNSSSSAEDADSSMTGFPFPPQRWQSIPSSRPLTMPTERSPYFPIPTSSQSRVNRRRSAPELATDDPHEIERMQKYASRRASHNVVEKRYRVNLNKKFYELEQVVLNATETCPSFNSPSSSSSPRSVLSTCKNANLSARPEGALEAPRHRSPKATIIDSALSYIESLRNENVALKGKLRAYESLGTPSSSGHSKRRGLENHHNHRGHRQEQRLDVDKYDHGCEPKDPAVKLEN